MKSSGESVALPVPGRERITEIDVARGLALFLTVLGHVLLSSGVWFGWIFSFHMPAFFFLSGMTFRPEKAGSFGAFVRGRLRKRIVPYFAAIAAGTAVCMLRPDYREVLFQFDWKYLLTWAFYYAQPKELYVGQVWFLAALFFAEILAYGWLRLFRGRNLLVRGYSLLLIAWLGTQIRGIDPYLPWGERLPWKLDTAIVAFVFLLFGYYASELHLLERFRKYAWLCGPLCAYLNYCFGVRFLGSTNMCDCVYVSAEYYYTAAFLGIIALLSCAVILRESRFWQFCGRNSLIMFIVQTFAIYLVLDAVTAVTGVKYTPMRDIPGDAFALAVSIAAFIIMAGFAVVWNRCRGRVEQMRRPDFFPCRSRGKNKNL